MATITFDTLKFTRKLEAAGFTQEQAEAFRDASGEAELATRQDLRELNLHLEAKINEIKFDLAKWIAGILKQSDLQRNSEAYCALRVDQNEAEALDLGSSPFLSGATQRDAPDLLGYPASPFAHAEPA